jgi:exosortase
MSAEKSSFARLPRLAKACIVALLFFAAFLSWLLWPVWIHNPDLSHGILMPVIFCFLVYQSRSEGPWRFLNGRAATVVSGLLVACALGLLILAGLYAAVLDWSHALVIFLLAGSLAFFLAAGLAAFANRRLQFVPCNWTAVAAASLWLLCAPIPPGTYSRITAALQLWVSVRVVQSLHLLGVPAFRDGNIIELAHARVGVEEACSGVRSLVSCIFAGLFFSASLVTRPWSRVLIILLAPILALAMNFVRSLALTLMASRGIEIEGFWHNITGFAVLGITAALLGGLAVLLRRSQSAFAEASADGSANASARADPASVAWLSVALGLAVALVIFFYANTRSFSRDNRGAVPDLLAILPSSEAGWRVKTTGDLYQFRDILQTDLLAQRVYWRGLGSEHTEIILYLAYWRPGQAPVSIVASHTPDACWPGSGWEARTLPGSGDPLSIQGRPLPDAEGRLFTNAGYPQYVWFWHLYQGRPIPYQNPYSLKELLSIAWHYGFRHNGDQLFVRASSNRPWSEIAREPILEDFFARLRPLGL